MISVGDLRPGITFEYEGNLYVVLDYSHNKTARAAANIKVKMKICVLEQLLKLLLVEMIK